MSGMTESNRIESFDTPSRAWGYQPQKRRRFCSKTSTESDRFGGYFLHIDFLGFKPGPEPMVSDGIKLGPGSLSSWFHVCNSKCILVVFMNGGLESKERGRS
jgi:hypothetical protein